MPQEEVGSIRRNLSLTRRRSFRSRVDGDDRGWTLLHIGARKGDLRQVGDLIVLNAIPVVLVVYFRRVCLYHFCSR